MTLFLITFLSLYGGMHLYALIRIERAFNPGRKALAILRCLMFLGTVAPFLVRMCEQSGLEWTTQILAWTGYTWMGFIFILISALLTLDMFRLVIFRINRKRGTAIPRFFQPRLSCEAALLFAVMASSYGFFEARAIRTEQVTIASSKLPSNIARIRIIQLSDVHLGLLIREERLRKVLRIVEQKSPDILVSTGDLLDGRLSRREGSSNYRIMAAMLAAVKAPSGKFAITGNHEFYAGLDQSLEVMKAAGFRVLRNEAVVLANGLVLSGSDDPAWKRMALPVPPGLAEHDLLRTLPSDRFRLHLKHRPDVEDQDQGLFDLQLSGHTHHGQIFPFYLLTKLQFPLCDGTSFLNNGSMIHVSRGTGTWGPPIRFLAPPEITVIDIVPATPTQPSSR
ncbi:MAG: metallophosphoesterase [Desulfuromonadales bacterium]|nr:metallophosphoesterase [Desulfuromonadales bacterium]